MVANVRILIVDDDSKMRDLLQKVLVREKYEVHLAGNGTEAMAQIREQPFDIVLSDVRMPEMDGLTLLGQIKEAAPETTVVIMTAFGTVDSAVEAMKQGAYDYINKPFRMDEVLIVIGRIVEERQLRRQLVHMRQALEERYAFGKIIGKSQRMKDVYHTITRLAPTAATVLITGQSGTGKELVAQAIHYNSPHKDGLFVPVNCGAIPAELMESELFGHAKGSFSGAIAAKKGLFAEADGGTLFLDEIGDLDLSLQTKLLRVLQEKEIRPVGENHQIAVNARVVAATNQNLEEKVANGSFRQDLFYRLNVIPVVLPSLRQRPEDIPLLAQHFLEKYADENGAKQIAQEALPALLQYAWPGNVRELENVIERATILSPNREIGLDDLPDKLRSDHSSLLARSVQEGVSLEEMEKEYILLVLDRVKGNQTRAADILGIDRRTLYRKLQQYQEEK